MATPSPARAPVRKPTPRQLQNLSEGQESSSVRTFEISQVQSRYKSSFRNSTSDDDTFQLKIIPSDPDFPYDIESLHIELKVPKEYPQKSSCSVKVLNKDIPVGFTTNLERGFAEAAQQKKSLLAHLNWLDVNMELLLQKPPVSTIRFVGHGQQSAGTVSAGHLGSSLAALSLPPPLPVSPEATPAATTEVTSTRPQHLSTVVPILKPAKKQFTIQEIEQAGTQRLKQLNQIQARFRSTFTAISVTEFRIGLESVNQAQKMPVSWDGPLWIHLLVPKIYPLEHCEIRLKQDNQNPEIEQWRARNVEQGVRKIVSSSPQLSLFQLLNQLNRDLKGFLDMENQSTTSTTNAEVTHLTRLHVQRPSAQKHLSSSQSSSSQSSTTAAAALNSKALSTEQKVTRDHGFGNNNDDSKRNPKLIYLDTPAQRPPRRNFELHGDHGAMTSEDDDDEDVGDSGGSSSEVEGEQNEAGGELTDDVSDDNRDTEDEGTGPRGPAVDTVAPKRGVEIRMPGLKLEHISLMYCRSLNLLVRCNRCKGLFEIADLQPDDSNPSHTSSISSSSSADKRKWRTCENCQSLMGAHFRTEYVHIQSRTLGFLDLAGCTAFDILPSAFVPTCSECDQILGASSGDLEPIMDSETASGSGLGSTTVAPRSQLGTGLGHSMPVGFRQRVGRGMSATANCRKCHVRLTFSMEGEIKFVKLSPGDMMKASASDLEQLPLKKKVVNRKAKNGGLDFELKVGEPLPRKGACNHYKKSRRWFRFPCCSKIFACHLCHDEKEDHESEFAKRMICGHCSREQTVSDKPCICGESPVRTSGGSGAFWEGGEGMRDKTKMSNKDSRKHRGLNKTVAKKQVGAENIRKRASKAPKI